MKHKRSLLLIFSICFFSIHTFCQIGIHAGSNISYLYTKDYSTSKGQQSHSLGISVGIDYEKEIAKNLFIQPELNYTYLKGGLTEVLLGVGKYKESLLSLPILIKYKPSGSNFGIYAGPQYNYLLNFKTSDISNTSLYADATDAIIKSSIGGTTGIEYAFKLKNNRLLIPSFRYTFDLTNSARKAVMGNNATLRNNYYTLTIGYRF